MTLIRRFNLSRWRDHALVMQVALAASLAGFWNVFAHDDVSMIAENLRLQSLSNAGEILTSPYWPPPYAPELYRPVASLLLTLQYAIGDGAPVVFRVVSYLLYAWVAVALFGLAKSFLPRRVAIAVAVLFAAHPVHVEAVALGVNQGELMVGLLAVFMVGYYVKARRAGDLEIHDWVVLASLYATAALTKENGFILPGLLLAADLTLVNDRPLREEVGRLWRGRLVLAGVGAALIALRTAVLAGNFVGTFTAEALTGLTLSQRALTMLQVVPMWFRLLTWPAHLQVDYSPNEINASTHFGSAEAAGLAVLLSAVAIAWWARKRAPLVTFGLAWCAVALIPVSNVLVPTSVVLAERTLFLPSIGFLLAAGGLGAYLLGNPKWPALHNRRLLVGACSVVALLGIARSAERHTVWRNNAHLWLVSVNDAPNSYRVQRAHGDALFALGDTAGAIHEYNRAIAASPTPWRIRFELAMRLRDMGKDTAALAQLRMSVAENSRQSDANVQLAATLLAVGRYKEAKLAAIMIIAEGNADTTDLREIEQAADSAAAVEAPAGTIRMFIRMEPDGPIIQPRMNRP